jgi:hypothetical protein
MIILIFPNGRVISRRRDNGGAAAEQTTTDA